MSILPIGSRNDRLVGKGKFEIRDEEISPLDDEAPRALSAEEERRLWRKVDVRLMPILSVMYLLSFMDRSNIGNAKLEGLMTELYLTGDRYNIALTMFFISYCTFECPANLVLKVFRPSRWLPGIMVLWGSVMTAMGFVKTYPELVGARFCLGVAEAGLFPGVVYYLTLWYPRHMLQYRVGLFFGAATVAGAFSGLLAFGIAYMDGVGHLEGWSWIFIVEGLLTVVVGFIAFFVIHDFPSTASFLTPEERAYLIWRKKYDNSSVGEEERFAFRHIVAAFTDWQVYLHLLVYISVITPLYGITFFLPTIIKSFGYTTAISQLLTVPPYFVATIVLLIWGHYSDKLKIRSVFIYSGLLLLLIGYSINILDAPNSVKYFGTYLIVVGSYASFPGVIAWLGNNLAGQYKRGVGMAIHIGFGNFGGAIAANVYRTRDSPRFILGHGLELMFVGIGLITVPILVFVYKRINDARDAALRRRIARKEKLQLSIQQLRDLGDRAPDFRYTL
ncbi:MFS general substrate transporter [Boletus edulis BED1]|uniref:MFS general substrate transporter n=1 Tax=Boletus edulis BED1 TaxID=1328754 RepID=A0AAD4G8G2_BOLED|nr:MFS general substrate transporter [Boletus edulis BED1]